MWVHDLTTQRFGVFFYVDTDCLTLIFSTLQLFWLNWPFILQFYRKLQMSLGKRMFSCLVLQLLGLIKDICSYISEDVLYLEWTSVILLKPDSVKSKLLLPNDRSHVIRGTPPRRWWKFVQTTLLTTYSYLASLWKSVGVVFHQDMSDRNGYSETAGRDLSWNVRMVQRPEGIVARL